MSLIDFLVEQNYQVTVTKNNIALKTPDGKNKTISYNGDYEAALRNWLGAREVIGPEIMGIINHIQYLLENAVESPLSMATFEYKDAMCLVGILTACKPRTPEEGIKITIQSNIRVLDELLYDSRIEEIIAAVGGMDCGYSCTVNKLPTIVGGTYRFECIFTKN